MTSALDHLDPASVDLADTRYHNDGTLHPVWDWLRRNDPVHWTVRPNGMEYWSVTTHAEAVCVLRDSKAFSSQQGMRLGGDPRAVDAAARKMLIVTDPPRHGEIRRIISSVFTARTVHRLEQSMRRTVTESLDQALEEGTCDFVETAARLPVSVICELLGVPPEDWDFMRECTTVAFSATTEDGAPAPAAIEAHTDLLLYYSKLVQRRRSNPGDDVITALIHGKVNGVPLTDEEIFLNCDGLISGGNETTRHAAVGGVLAFVADQGQWEALRARPELLPTAVDEILRWTSPAAHTLRTATRDVDLAGRRVREGQSVVVWGPSANRDESVFESADEFRVDRTPNRHLTFGHGTHYCLGGALAASELRVLFGELTRRVTAFEVSGPIRRIRSNHIAGFEEAHVTLMPAADDRAEHE